MSYESIDPVIRAWAERHALSVFTGIEGMEDVPFRSVQLSGENGESCQIWIEPPEAERVSLHATGVETRMNEELRQDWCVPVAELQNALEQAFSFVKQWMQR